MEHFWNVQGETDSLAKDIGKLLETLEANKEVSQMELEAFDGKLKEKYETFLKHVTKKDRKGLSGEINKAKEEIVTHPEQKWKILFKLMQRFQCIPIQIKQDKAIIARKRKVSSKVEVKVLSNVDQLEKLEKQFQMYYNRVESHAKEEVDWQSDDDLKKKKSSSSYLQQAYCMKKCVELHKEIVSLRKTMDLTKEGLEDEDETSVLSDEDDREIDDKPWNLKGICKYPEIENEIEEFFSSRPPAEFQDAPDYQDIFEIVKKVKEENFLEFNLKDVALEIFKSVMQVVKQRNKKTLFSVIPGLGDDDLRDPAESDPELEKKLMDNRIESDTQTENVFNSYDTTDSEGEGNPEPDENTASDKDIVNSDLEDEARELEFTQCASPIKDFASPPDSQTSPIPMDVESDNDSDFEDYKRK